MPDQDANSTAGTDDRPSWDLYRRMAESPHVSLARRQATLWALGELEQRMGPDWLERYWDRTGHVPEEVNLGGHTQGRSEVSLISPCGCSCSMALPEPRACSGR